jgi:uncharacterized membrane protein
LKNLAAVTGILALAATVGLILSLLALADIGQGEADLEMEWWMVRVTSAVLVAFLVCTLALVKRVLDLP